MPGRRGLRCPLAHLPSGPRGRHTPAALGRRVYDAGPLLRKLRAATRFVKQQSSSAGGRSALPLGMGLNPLPTRKGWTASFAVSDPGSIPSPD